MCKNNQSCNNLPTKLFLQTFSVRCQYKHCYSIATDSVADIFKLKKYYIGYQITNLSTRYLQLF